MIGETRSIVLEFSRTEAPEDPHAFRFAPQDYTLRAADGRRARLSIPWSRELLRELADLRRPDRDPALVQRVGERLHTFLAPAGVDQLARDIEEALADGRGVIVTIRSNAAELYALPWELLTVGPSGRHLGALEGVLVRHEWPGARGAQEEPDPRPEGGRVLLAWSAAGGSVPVEEHLRAIESSCLDGHVEFDAARDVLAHASAEGLAAALAAEPPVAILHLLCHGGLAGSTFGLVLDGVNGDAVTLDAGRLRELLAPHAGRVRLVVLAACDGGNTGELGNQLGSVAQALHRAGIAAVVASRYPLSVAGSGVLAAALYRALLVELCSLERALLRARAQLVRDPTTLDWASVTLHACAADGDDTRPLVFRPYRGLLPFHAEHARLFFGRDAERQETLVDLQALVDAGKPRFLVIAGASGTGKSSMVLAGAIPDLLAQGGEAQADDGAAQLLARARRDLEEAARRRGGAHVQAALAALERAGTSLSLQTSKWRCRVTRPGNRPMAALDAALEGHAPGRRLLLLIDQFEEIFTLTADPSVREGYCRRLWALAQGDSGIHCVITIRVDFLGHCGHVVLDEAGTRLDRVAYSEGHRVFVAQMRPDQLREAIEEPARLVGLALEAGLTERILADAGHEPGALPLIQYALDLLWQRREGRALTARAYEELGGVIGALQRRADAIIDALSPAERQQARRLMTRLVTLGDDEGTRTRRRAELQSVEPDDEPARTLFHAVLERLASARLVVRNDEAGTPTLEVAHEALIRKWPRMNRWIFQDRDKLGQLETLEGWARECLEHRTLLTGGQLGYALQVLAKHAEEVDSSIRALVAASARRERRRRGALIGATLLFAGLGVISLVLLQMTRVKEREAQDSAAQAERNAGEAQRQAKRAREAQVAADAQGRRSRDGLRMSAAESLDDSTALAMGFLREAEAADPQAAIRGWSSYAYASLTESWIEDARLVGHTGEVNTASFSPDGSRVVTASGDGTARLWTARDGAFERELTGHAASVRSASFSRDGARVLTVGEDATVRLWDVMHPRRPAVVLEGHAGGVSVAQMSRDATRVFTSGRDLDDGWIWDAHSGQRLVALEGHEGEINAADFSASGNQLITGSMDGTARVWDVEHGVSLRTLRRHRGPVMSAIFSDEVTAITASVDGLVIVWDLARQRPRQTFELGRSDRYEVAELGVDPYMSTWLTIDGRRLLMTSIDSTQLRVRGETLAPFVTPVGPDGEALRELRDNADEPVFAARFAPRGDVIVGRSLDPEHYARPVIFDAESGAVAAELGGHRRPVTSTEFSPDGRRLVTASADGTARIWRAESATSVTFGRDIEGDLGGRFVSPDGSMVVASVDDGARVAISRLDDPGAGAAPALEVASEPGRLVVAFHPREKQVAVATRAKVRVVDPSVEEPPRAPIVAAGDRLEALAYSASGARLVTTTSPKVQVWELATGRELAAIAFTAGDDGDEPGERVAAIHSAIDPADEDRVVTAVHDRTIRVWDARTGEEQRRLTLAHVAVEVAFAGDGRLLLARSLSGPIYVWDTEGWALRSTLGSSVTAVYAMAIDPTGTRVAGGCADKSARVWGLELGDEQLVVRGHLQEVTNVAFSPDGGQLLTGSSDGMALLWDARTGVQLSAIGHGEPVAAVAFGRDGAITVTLSGDGELQAWPTNFSSAWLLEELWGATRACPSVEDRMEHLSVDRALAKRDDARCQAMIRCVHDRVPDWDYAACLQEFRRAQAAGAAFTGDG